MNRPLASSQSRDFGVEATVEVRPVAVVLEPGLRDPAGQPFAVAPGQFVVQQQQQEVEWAVARCFNPGRDGIVPPGELELAKLGAEDVPGGQHASPARNAAGPPKDAPTADAGGGPSAAGGRWS